MDQMVYVGLDVHTDTIAVALADEGRAGEVRFFGTIANSADSVLQLTKRLTTKGRMAEFCYEAGPCGYGLYRHLTRLGFECAVVAPAMIPRKVGDRVKTDRPMRKCSRGFGGPENSPRSGRLMKNRRRCGI